MRQNQIFLCGLVVIKDKQRFCGLPHGVEPRLWEAEVQHKNIPSLYVQLSCNAVVGTDVFGCIAKVAPGRISSTKTIRARKMKDDQRDILFVCTRVHLIIPRLGLVCQN